MEDTHQNRFNFNLRQSIRVGKLRISVGDIIEARVAGKTLRGEVIDVDKKYYTISLLTYDGQQAMLRVNKISSLVIIKSVDQ